MTSANTQSANEHTRTYLVHTVQLKTKIKEQISGRIASIVKGDVVKASEDSENSNLRKFMMMKMIIIITEKPFTSK